MNEERFDEKVLRGYLLGELGDAEQEAVESAYLRRPELCAELLALEDELIDESVAGGLSAAQARALELRLRLAPDGPQRVALARALAARAAAAPAANADLQDARTPASSWAPTWALAAALLVCAGLGAFFGLRARTLERDLVEARAERERLTRASAQLEAQTQALREELERERRAAEALDEPARGPRPGAVVRLLLAAGRSRESAARAEVQLPAAADTLQLALELDDPAFARYTALLQTPEGATVWRQSELASRPQAGQRVVLFRVPAARVPPGDYVVLLQATSAAGTPEDAGEYAFRVTR